MLKIDNEPWSVMLQHAKDAFPKECCGILLGVLDDERRTVTAAVPCRNAYDGEQADRFLIDPVDQLAAQKRARAEDLEVLGFFHSHPDCDAYFSATDLANSWPWYSNVVISIMNGEFNRAACFRANDDQSASAPEELIHP